MSLGRVHDRVLLPDFVKEEYQKLWKLFTSATSNRVFPDERDLEMMSVNMNRIQHTYGLDVRDLANGVVRGIKSEAKLNRDEV